MKTNTQKQAEYRARMRDKGYILVRAWIPKGQEEKARKYLKRLSDE